jgi:hypothetical protein
MWQFARSIRAVRSRSDEGPGFLGGSVTWRPLSPEVLDPWRLIKAATQPAPIPPNARATSAQRPSSETSAAPKIAEIDRRKPAEAIWHMRTSTGPSPRRGATDPLGRLAVLQEMRSRSEPPPSLMLLPRGDREMTAAPHPQRLTHHDWVCRKAPLDPRPAFIEKGWPAEGITVRPGRINTGSTSQPEPARERSRRSRATMRPREHSRTAANPPGSTSNPRVAGSNPARRIGKAPRSDAVFPYFGDWRRNHGPKGCPKACSGKSSRGRSGLQKKRDEYADAGA